MTVMEKIIALAGRYEPFGVGFVEVLRLMSESGIKDFDKALEYVPEEIRKTLDSRPNN